MAKDNDQGCAAFLAVAGVVLALFVAASVASFVWDLVATFLYLYRVWASAFAAFSCLLFVPVVVECLAELPLLRTLASLVPGFPSFTRSLYRWFWSAWFSILFPIAACFMITLHYGSDALMPEGLDLNWTWPPRELFSREWIFGELFHQPEHMAAMAGIVSASGSYWMSKAFQGTLRKFPSLLSGPIRLLGI